jgi:hypothetical protein
MPVVAPIVIGGGGALLRILGPKAAKFFARGTVKQGTKKVTTAPKPKITSATTPKVQKKFEPVMTRKELSGAIKREQVKKALGSPSIRGAATSTAARGGKVRQTAMKIATWGAPKGGAPMKHKTLKLTALGTAGYLLYDWDQSRRSGTPPKSSGSPNVSAAIRDKGVGGGVRTPQIKFTEKPNIGTPPTSGSATAKKKTGTGGGAARSRGAAVSKPAKVKVKDKKPTMTVSQSRTMWVKKGDVVGGQEVKKGYLAQYGRAEKKVSAKVNIVADTESGKRVGETWKYQTGRTVAKVKKKNR